MKILFIIYLAQPRGNQTFRCHESPKILIRKCRDHSSSPVTSDRS